MAPTLLTHCAMNVSTRLSMLALGASTLLASTNARAAANGFWTRVGGQIQVTSNAPPAEPTVTLDQSAMGGPETLPRLHYRITGALASTLSQFDGMKVSFKGYAVTESVEGADIQYNIRPRANARVTLTGVVEELGFTTDMQGTHKLSWTDREGNPRSLVLDAPDSADAAALDSLLGTAVQVTGRLGSTVESGRPILRVRDVARYVPILGPSSGSNAARNENTVPESNSVAQSPSTGAGVTR